MSAGTPARRCDFGRSIGNPCGQPATRISVDGSTLGPDPLHWCDKHALPWDAPIPGTPSHTGEVTDG